MTDGTLSRAWSVPSASAAIAVGVAAQVMRDISAQAGADDKAVDAGSVCDRDVAEGGSCAAGACAACGLP
jgi:hypothetical protein